MLEGNQSCITSTHQGLRMYIPDTRQGSWYRYSYKTRFALV